MRPFSDSPFKNELRPPAYLKLRSSRSFITASVCCAVFTDIFLYALIVPVLPFSLGGEQGIIQDDGIAEWTAILLTCYSAGLFVASPIAGWYADQSESRRAPFLISIALLTVSTAMLCFAPTIEWLVISRIGQGASAGIVWSVGLALIADSYGRDVGKVMGYTEVSVSVGLVGAPVLGGALYENFGYYSVYTVAFLVLLIDFIMRILFIEPNEAARWALGARAFDLEASKEEAAWALARDDSMGLMQDDAALPLVTRTSEDFPPLPPSPTSTESTLAFPIIPKKKRRHPVLTLLSYPRVLAALFGVVVESATMSSLDAVLPLFVQDNFNWTSFQAGLLFLAVYVPGLCDPLIGWLSDSFGARWSALAGFALASPIWLLFQLVPVTEPEPSSSLLLEHQTLLVILLSLIGITLSLASLPMMAEINYAIKEKAAVDPGVWGSRGVRGVTALSYGLFCMAFAVGGVVGSLIGGMIYALLSWAAFCYAMAALCGVAAVVVAFCTPSKGIHDEEDEEEGGEDSANQSELSEDPEDKITALLL